MLHLGVELTIELSKKMFYKDLTCDHLPLSHRFFAIVTTTCGPLIFSSVFYFQKKLLDQNLRIQIFLLIERLRFLYLHLVHKYYMLYILVEKKTSSKNKLI